MIYRKAVIQLIIITTLIRGIVAASTELSNDEVYYWTYALHLQWNYFDHPPLLAWLIRVFTFNLQFQQEFFVRLGAVLCGAINTWQVYRIASSINNERTGWIAACLFTASLYGSLLAGLLILPDAPQLVCWLWSVSIMLQIFGRVGNERSLNRQWLLLGFSIGLCMLGKLHGVFLWVGAGLYLLLYDRRKLLSPFPYLAVLVSLLLLLPVILWNVQYDFITYRYHGNRVGFFGPVQWDSFFRQVLGEFLYNNPVNMVLIIMGVRLVIRKQHTIEINIFQLFILVSVPLIAVVWFMALFRDTLPHWTGPAYTTLIPLAAVFIERRLRQRTTRSPLHVPAYMKTAMAIPLIAILGLLLSIHFLHRPLGKQEPAALGSGDLLLDLSGWKQFGIDFRKLYEQDVADGFMKKNATIITDYWFPAAHLDYYVTSPGGLPFMAIGTLHNIHHYAWLNQQRPPLKIGGDAYYIGVSNYFDPPPPRLLQAFEQTEPPIVLSQYRGKAKVRNFFIYRLRNYRSGITENGVLPE